MNLAQRLTSSDSLYFPWTQSVSLCLSSPLRSEILDRLRMKGINQGSVAIVASVPVESIYSKSVGEVSHRRVDRGTWRMPDVPPPPGAGVSSHVIQRMFRAIMVAQACFVRHSRQMLRILDVAQSDIFDCLHHVANSMDWLNDTMEHGMSVME